MLSLQNNCRAGKFSVHPKNWEAKNASTKNYWYISYRFYDDNMQRKKQVMIQGMNHLSNLAERQSLTKVLIEKELHNLEKGYNPITGKYFQPIEKKIENEIVSSRTLFYEALEKAEASLNLEEGFTSKEMKWILDNIRKFVSKVMVDREHLDEVSIGNIRKRHVRALMDMMSAEQQWSPYLWNKYRSYLMILFKELSEYDAVEYNIPREISKKKIIKKIREVLSDEDRQKIREYLPAHNPRLWLFVNMFFHSGARIIEFFRMKVGDVDLTGQTMKVLIMKGRQYVEVMKPIKDVSLPYWKEYLNGFTDKKNFYLIGKGLYPDEKPIRHDQIRHRWQRVKRNIGITADFYSLKHLNSDQVAAELGIQYAQKLNSHTSESTTRIYAVNQQARDMELIKHVANEF